MRFLLFLTGRPWEVGDYPPGGCWPGVTLAAVLRAFGSTSAGTDGLPLSPGPRQG